MKIMQKQFMFHWLPVMIFCTVIFVLSSLPSPDVGPSFPMKDKVLHMTAYGIMAALFCRACRATWPGRLSLLQLMAVGVCFATLYGLGDEFHQSFVSARQADGFDVLADLIGSILGSAGYVAATRNTGLNRF
jgi:VanZ family protein